MASNHTEHYRLNQWEPGDKVLRTDFNADNLKIDGALAALEGEALRVVVGTYTGAGVYGENNPCTLDFTASLGRPPQLVIIRPEGGGNTGLFLIRGMAGSNNHFTNSYISGSSNAVSWSGNKITWYGGNAEGQLNSYGVVYRYFAIG